MLAISELQDILKDKIQKVQNCLWTQHSDEHSSAVHEMQTQRLSQLQIFAQILLRPEKTIQLERHFERLNNLKPKAEPKMGLARPN